MDGIGRFFSSLKHGVLFSFLVSIFSCTRCPFPLPCTSSSPGIAKKRERRSEPAMESMTGLDWTGEIYRCGWMRFHVVEWSAMDGFFLRYESTINQSINNKSSSYHYRHHHYRHHSLATAGKGNSIVNVRDDLVGVRRWLCYASCLLAWMNGWSVGRAVERNVVVLHKELSTS